jgi:hypothetical protein
MKIIFLLAACLSSCIAIGFAATSYRVIDHQEEEGIGTYTVLIPASEFRKEALASLAAQFLSRDAHLRFLDVGIYTDRASVYEYTGAGITDYNFETWLNEFEVRRKRPLPCGAEILKSGTAAALRARYSDGHIDELAIRGGSVFHPVIKGLKLDLLHVLCVRQMFGSPRPRLTPQLYFSVSKYITPQEGGAIARAILDSSGVPRMWISLRPDKWFMFDPYYPWVNPFAPVDSPPTTEAKEAWELLCHPPDEQRCFQAHGK